MSYVVQCLSKLPELTGRAWGEPTCSSPHGGLLHRLSRLSEMATSKYSTRSTRNDVYFMLTEKFPRGISPGAAGTMCFISEEKYLTVFNDDVTPSGTLYVTLLDSSAWVKTVTVDVNILQPLTKKQAELLYAINDTAERLNCFLDKNALEDALNAQLGQEVMVVIGEEVYPAIIRYIGKVHESSPLVEVLFGVELQGNGQGKGRTNGSFRYKTYFRCKKDCGIFVPFNKIAFSSSKNHTPEQKNQHTADVSPVKPGDQVGFYFEDDLKHGTVVVLENHFPERFVHVSLDDGSDDPWKIPMDSVIKQEILSPEFEKGDRMEIDNPKQSNMELNSGKKEEGNFSTHCLGVNSMVQLNYSGNLAFGIIRWLGFLPDSKHFMAGVELDEEKGITDGTWKGQRYFDCAPKKGVFVKHQACQPDMRFHSSNSSLPKELDTTFYTGGPESTPVLDNQPPLMNDTAVNVLMGRMKGIQGHCNSCYMDAALFSLFSCTSVLDSMLFKPPNPADAHIQSILREEIVNPLRRNGFVSANSVMKLRHQLTKESQSPSFATSEKDPEEFLNIMMHHILAIEPLLKLQSGGQKEQECYCYQIFMEKQEDMVVPDVQQLVVHSFLSSDLKLAEIPSCFIIQMPRFGKEYKMFSKIIPSLELDITDLLLESPRECIVCGELASLECTECFKDPMFANSLVKQYCDKCCKQAHGHYKRQWHKPRKLKIPAVFESSHHPRTTRIPQEKMELFAVLCIETSHYVAFVKYGPEKENWIFFDSMADRYGDDNGYNIPTVTLCPEVAKYLESPVAELAEKRPREMEGVAKRLFCDAYMYMYQSKKMSLYK